MIKDILNKEIIIFKREKEKNEKLIKKLESLANICIYIAFLLIPFIISFSKNGPINLFGYRLDVYTDTKVLLLYIISVILVIIFILIGKYEFDLIDKLVLIFLVIITISTIYSINPIISLFGNKGRMEGLVTIVCYCILFIMSRRYMKVNKKIFEVFLLMGVLMAIYGVLQFFGLDPITNYLGAEGMAVGLIGHRNFFSSYLLILLGFSISIYIFYGKIRFYIYSSIYFSALIATTTRGGWLTLGIMCLIGLIFIVKKTQHIKRAILITITFISIFFSMNYISGGILGDRFNSMKNDISNITEKSGSGRIYVWKTSFKVFKEYPILGCGPDVLSDAIISDFPDDLTIWQNEFENTLIDKAHNEYLNYAATTGIFSLIVYLLLVIIILKNVVRNISDDRFKVLFIVIIGYLIQANFNISVVGVAPIFWIILGVASNSNIIKNIDI